MIDNFHTLYPESQNGIGEQINCGPPGQTDVDYREENVIKSQSEVESDGKIDLNNNSNPKFKEKPMKGSKKFDEVKFLNNCKVM